MFGQTFKRFRGSTGNDGYAALFLNDGYTPGLPTLFPMILPVCCLLPVHAFGSPLFRLVLYLRGVVLGDVPSNPHPCDGRILFPVLISGEVFFHF